MTAYFTEEEAQALRQEYEAGVSVTALAIKHHCDKTTVYNYIKQAGGTLTARKHDRKEIAKLYQSGMSVSQIRRKLGCSGWPIYQALKEYGVPVRAQKKPRSRYDNIKQMMIHDWNTGRSTAQMAKIYKATSQQIASLMCVWRAKGEEIEWRRK